jgi:hypothetical protein
LTTQSYCNECNGDGEYQRGFGGSICQSCGGGKTYLVRASDPTLDSCSPCPSGATCVTGGEPAAPDHNWITTLTNGEVVVKTCASDTACLGGVCSGSMINGTLVGCCASDRKPFDNPLCGQCLNQYGYAGNVCLNGMSSFFDMNRQMLDDCIPHI